MDTAVALVKSYLQANGFFTVTEYPILEVVGSEARTVTDMDVLALRFPGAGGFASAAAETRGLRIEPDAELELSEQEIEVIIAEVKEGAALLNRAARDPAVLTAVLRRFGEMRQEVEEKLVEELGESGTAVHPMGIRFRIMVFASKPPVRRHVHYQWISHAHVARWLQKQVQDNWDQIKTIQSKDPALGFLLLFEKAVRGES